MCDFEHCRLCPRGCGADRTKGAGFCGAPAQIRAARAGLHFGEEPCISGVRGSGAIFFSGCNLRCCFCQNYELSHHAYGKDITRERLAQIMLELQEQGAHNINLVSASPYAPLIAAVLQGLYGKLRIPVVYNNGGYESIDTLSILKGYINIYLPDFKYFSPVLAERYSGASDYAERALDALHEMVAQTGAPQFDEQGIMRSGTLVRHLLLPGAYRDSLEILRLLRAEFPPGSFLLSLMCQYTPAFLRGDFPELKRAVTSYEYKMVLAEAERLGFDQGYSQERASVGAAYTPHFGLEGL